MNDYIAFLDEWGNNGLDFTKSGVSTHFIVSAITLRKKQLSEAETQLEAVLADPAYRRTSAWNQLPAAEKGRVVELALERPDLSCRELACYIVDMRGGLSRSLQSTGF